MKVLNLKQLKVKGLKLKKKKKKEKEKEKEEEKPIKEWIESVYYRTR